DRGDAKEVVGHEVVPGRGIDALAPGPPAIELDVLALGGNAERLEVQPADAAELPRRDVPAHAVIGEVGERMAERGELPVEHGEDAGLGRMEDDVVEAVVAMHNGGLVASRDVAGQPGDEVVHRLD